MTEPKICCDLCALYNQDMTYWGCAKKFCECHAPVRCCKVCNTTNDLSNWFCGDKNCRCHTPVSEPLIPLDVIDRIGTVDDTSEPSLRGKIAEMLGLIKETRADLLDGGVYDKFPARDKVLITTNRLEESAKAILALVEKPTPTPPPAEVCCDNGNFGDGHECLKAPPTEGWRDSFARRAFDPVLYSNGRKYIRYDEVEDFIDVTITKALAEQKARMVEVVKEVPVEYAHTYIYMAMYDAGQEQMKERIIKALSK